MSPEERKAIASEVSETIQSFLQDRFNDPSFTLHDVMLACSKKGDWKRFSKYSFVEVDNAYSISIISVVEGLVRIGYILPDQSGECYIPGPLGSEEVISFAYSQKGG